MKIKKIILISLIVIIMLSSFTYTQENENEKFKQILEKGEAKANLLDKGEYVLKVKKFTKYEKIDPEFVYRLQDQKRIRIIIDLKDKDISQTSLSKKLKKLKKGDEENDFGVVHTFEKNKKYGYNQIVGYADIDTINALEDDPNVVQISEDKKIYIETAESTVLINSTIVNQLSVNGTNIDGEGYTVCLLDTGVDIDHPDLPECDESSGITTGCIIHEGDYYYQDGDPDDDNGHGTHIAGIILAVAPKVKIINQKVINREGTGYIRDTDIAILNCAANKSIYNITSLSMSFSDATEHNSENCPSASNFWDDEFIVTINANITNVAAAGNQGHTQGIAWPACSPYTVSVGATDKNDVYQPYSNRGAGLVDVLAPGGSSSRLIRSTCRGGGYCNKYGTSMATPHVTAAIALLNQYYDLTNNPKTPDEIEQILKLSGKPISYQTYTWPRINVLEAIGEQYDCLENWERDDNPCIADQRLISYTDINNCNTTYNLPIDNGTYELPNWVRDDPPCVNNYSTIFYIDTNCNSTSNRPSDHGDPYFCGQLQCGDGMISYWTFDDNTAIDSIGNNDGTINGATSVAGKVGNAMNFDGTNNYITMNDKDVFSFDNGSQDSPLSIALWGYPDTTNDIILSKRDTSLGTNEYQIWLENSNVISIYFWDESTGGYIGRKTNSNAYTTLQWNHIIITYDGSSSMNGIKIYVNGTRVDTTDVSGGSYIAMENTNAPFYIGSINNPSYYFDGTIDEVAIWNRSLTETEIQELYDNSNQGFDYCYSGDCTQEICDNLIDDDCDGDVDMDDSDCFICINGQTRLCPNQIGVCNASIEICTDNDWPGCDYNLLPNYESIETTCDSLDNDCDGSTDQGLKTTYYQDSDSDLYGNNTVSQDECNAPIGYVENNTDCDDNNININPGKNEICNNLIDDDCDNDMDCNDNNCLGDPSCVDNPPDVSLKSPSNGISTIDTTVEFMCNISNDHVNVSFYMWNATTKALVHNNTFLLSGAGPSNVTYELPNIPVGEYLWNYMAYDDAGQQGWADNNWSLEIVSESGIPPTDNMTITQSITFQPGIYDFPNGIRVEANNIVIDGNGATIRGPGLSTEQSYGIILLVVKNVTIKNLVIQDYDVSIFPHSSTEINIFNNNISGYKYPIHTYLSNVSIFNNNIIKQNSSLYTFTNAINIYHSYQINIDSNNIQSFGRGNAINLEFTGWPGGTNCNITINYNNITTYNYSAKGIYSLGVNNHENISYQILHNNIETYGRHAYGIEMIKSISNISYNDISTHGRHADGIRLSHANNSMIVNNNFEIIKEYIYPGGSVIFFNNSWPIVELYSSNNIILNNIVNGFCSCSQEETVIESISNYSYVCTQIELIDTNNDGIIQTDELLNAIDKWIDQDLETNRLLNAIDQWLGS